MSRQCRFRRERVADIIYITIEFCRMTSEHRYRVAVITYLFIFIIYFIYLVSVDIAVIPSITLGVHCHVSLTPWRSLSSHATPPAD